MNLTISHRTKSVAAKRIAQTLWVGCILLVTACGGDGPKADPLKALRKEAEKSICADMRVLVQSSLDGVSAGMGSLVVGLVMSEAQQDSLLMKPVLPMMRAELKKCDKVTLEGIKRSKRDRYKFIASMLVNNKDNITASVSESYEFAAPFVEIAVKEAQALASGSGNEDPS
jgi:hypothetical protein